MSPQFPASRTVHQTKTPKNTAAFSLCLLRFEETISFRERRKGVHAHLFEDMQRKTEILAVFTLVLLTIVLIGSACAKNEPLGCGNADKAWNSNLALWRSKGLTDYDMVIQRFRNPMYGHVPFLVKVRNGKNISLTPARENSGQELTDGYEAVATVEQIFTIIEKACETGDKVVVEYDPENGIPRFFASSNIKANNDQADGYKVQQFVPLAK